MEPLVDIVIEDDRWDALGLEPLATRAVAAVLAGLGLGETGYTLCLMGCDDARIATLNADFRGTPQPTNVLSWPSEDRAAETPGTAPDLVTHLVVHGVLHLLGYDHVDAADGDLMEATEVAILARLGLSDPYS